MTPLLSLLASQGLSLLSSAIQAKGKEVIEEKLGIDLDKATQTEEGLLKLKQLELDHEEFLINANLEKVRLEIEANKSAQSNVTQRWQADMISDSWLSKNIRPLILIYLLVAYSLFSIGSGFGFSITQAYVELLGQMLMLAFAAYFAGRTIEKVKDMHERGKDS